MRGLFVGRFQPFHNGHASAVREALESVDELVIGIGSARQSGTKENPFTAGERGDMILRSLSRAEKGRVVLVQIPDRHDYGEWMDSVVALSPRFETVFTRSELTARLASLRGFTPVELSDWDSERFNGTGIRNAIASGKDWRKLVPPGTVEVIEEANGAGRVRRATDAKIADIPTLEELVVSGLKEAGATVAIAESCTGGLASQRLTSVPGASKVFRGAVVAYSDDAKTHALSVGKGTLAKHGAVSAKTAESMAVSVRRVFQSTYGVGITGVAGPAGGSPRKPVGTVFISATDGTATKDEEFAFSGVRNRIRLDASTEALKMMLDLAQLSHLAGD